MEWGHPQVGWNGDIPGWEGVGTSPSGMEWEHPRVGWNGDIPEW